MDSERSESTGTTGGPIQGGGREPQAGETLREVRVRRAPKIVPFLALGVALGALAGLLLELFGGQPSSPTDPQYSAAASTSFLAMTGGLLGLVLGGLVWALLDARGRR